MRRPLCAAAAMKAVLLGSALLAASYTAASATTIDFTWDPAATGNTTAGAFTADRFGINDWATIDVPANPSPTSSVTETGFLEISGFTLSGNPVSTVHTTGAGGYGIYETFTATSHLDPCSSGLCGAFDTISADTYIYSTLHGLASYTFPGSVPTIHLPNHANPILIATESGPLLGSSPNIALITSGVPSANVDVTFAPNAAESAFFVNPNSGVLLDLEQAFTNTPGVIVRVPPPGGPSSCEKHGVLVLPCTFEIKGGGGNGDFFRVPEPASFALLGLGLTALGLVRRRRRVG